MAQGTLLDYSLLFYNNACCLQLGNSIVIGLSATVPPGPTIDVQDIEIASVFGDGATALDSGGWNAFSSPGLLDGNNCLLSDDQEGTATVVPQGVPAPPAEVYLVLEGSFNVNQTLGATTITVTETTAQGGVRSTAFTLNKYPADTGLGQLQFRPQSATGTPVGRADYGSDIWITWTVQGAPTVKLLAGPGIDETVLTGQQQFQLGRVTDPSITVSLLVSLTDASGKPWHCIETATLAVAPLDLQASVGGGAVNLSWSAAQDAPMQLTWTGGAAPVTVTGKSSYSVDLSSLTESPTTFTLCCTDAPAGLASGEQQVQVFLDLSVVPPPTISAFKVTNPASMRADGTYLLTAGNSYELTWHLSQSPQAASISIQPPLGTAIAVTPTAGVAGAARTLPTSTTFTPAAMEGPVTLSVLDAQGGVLATATLTVLCQARLTPPAISQFSVTDYDSQDTDGSYALSAGDGYHLAWTCAGAQDGDRLQLLLPLGAPIDLGSASSTQSPYAFTPEAMRGLAWLRLLDATGQVLAASQPISLVVTENADSHLTYSLDTDPSPVSVNSPLSVTITIARGATAVSALKFTIYLPVLSGASGLTESLAGADVAVAYGTQPSPWQGWVDADAGLITVAATSGQPVALGSDALAVTISGIQVNAFVGVAILPMTAFTVHGQGADTRTLQTSVLFPLNKVEQQYTIKDFVSDKSSYYFGDPVNLTWSVSENVGTLLLHWEADNGSQQADVTGTSSYSAINTTSAGTTTFSLVGRYTLDGESKQMKKQWTIATTPAIADFNAVGSGDEVTLTWNTTKSIESCVLSWMSDSGEQLQSVLGLSSISVNKPTNSDITIFTLLTRNRSGAPIVRYQTMIGIADASPPAIADLMVQPESACSNWNPPTMDSDFSLSWTTKDPGAALKVTVPEPGVMGGEGTYDVTGTTSFSVGASGLPLGNSDVWLTASPSAGKGGEVVSYAIKTSVSRPIISDFTAKVTSHDGIYSYVKFTWNLCNTTEGMTLSLSLSGAQFSPPTAFDVTNAENFECDVLILPKHSGIPTAIITASNGMMYTAIITE